MLKRLSLFLAVYMAAFVVVQAADTGVRSGTLPNGITYYVSQNSYPAGRADFFLVRAMGSAVEEENERGLAHFLEHMCFNGTEHFPGNTLISWLESVGVKFGTNLNAYTSADETVYNISKVPVERMQVVDSCLLIMRDWSCALTLADKDIDDERGVIVNEWRQRNTAANRILERVAPQIYPGSSYGTRLPIGQMSVVENFKPEVLRAFYHKWHNTDNMAVVVVGDIDPDTVVEKIGELFGGIARSESDGKAVFDVPSTPSLIVAVESDPEQSVNMMQLHFKHAPASAASLEDEIRASLVSELLTSMLAGRFDIVEADPGCSYHHLGIGDMKFFLSRGGKSLMFRGISLPGREAETLATWYAELSRALRYGFRPGEFALAKADMKKTLERRMERRRSNTDIAKAYARLYLDGGFCTGDASEARLALSMLDSVSTQEVWDYLKSVVSADGSNTVVMLYKPESEISGNVTQAGLKDDLRKAFMSVNDMELEAYEDTFTGGSILAAEPVPGRIVEADSLACFGAQVFTLSNGVKVYARRNTAHPGQVYVRGISPGGLSVRYSEDVIPSMKLINEGVAVSRFGEYTAQELKKLLTGRDIAVTTDVDVTKETVEIATTAADMRDAFRLMYLKLTDVRPDSAAFAIMQRGQIETLGRRYANPTQAMGESIHRHVYSHHPLGAKLTAAVASRADYQTILDLYADRFGDVSDFTFYVAGDFDTDSLRSCLEDYVASLPAAGRDDRVRDIGYRFTPGNRNLCFRADMETPQAIVYTFYHGPSSYDIPTAVTATMLGQIVKSRLLADLRENKGWTYSITGHCSALPSMNDFDPSSFLFPIYVKTSPEHADDVASAVTDAIGRIASEDPSEQELSKVKGYLLKSDADNVSDNAYWLSVMKVYAENGLDMHDGFRKAVEAVTPADISEFARETVLKGEVTRLMMLPSEEDTK